MNDHEPSAKWFAPKRRPRLLYILLAGAVAVGGSAWYARVHGPAGAAAPRDPASTAIVASDGMLEDFDTRDLTLDRDRIIFGGPGKDGIPALEEPAAIGVAEAPHLRADDRVVGVRIGGVGRAYPMALLNWHEAVNDVLGDTPIAVLYCPLCDSISVVDRRLDGKTYAFGISGLLYNSNVLLYDGTDQALWSQVGLTAVSGPNAGKSLRHLPFEITTFGQWKQTHPDATVLSFETGHQRDYAENPYADYFSTERLIFPVQPLDQRLPPKARVVGVQLEDATKAYPLDAIQRSPNGILRDRVQGEQVVLKADHAGAVSMMEAPDGANVLHTFWFAWAAFHPATEIYQPAPAGRAEN